MYSFKNQILLISYYSLNYKEFPINYKEFQALDMIAIWRIKKDKERRQCRHSL